MMPQGLLTRFLFMAWPDDCPAAYSCAAAQTGAKQARPRVPGQRLSAVLPFASYAPCALPARQPGSQAASTNCTNHFPIARKFVSLWLRCGAAWQDISCVHNFALFMSVGCDATDATAAMQQNTAVACYPQLSLPFPYFSTCSRSLSLSLSLCIGIHCRTIILV